MLLECAPYCTQQIDALSRGLTLREIQPPPATGEHPWLTDFQKELARQDLAAVTVRGYGTDVADFLRWYGSAALDRLTRVDLLHYRQHLTKDRNAKPATVNRKLEALRRFSRWAHSHGKLAEHVAAEVTLTRAVRGQCPKGLNAAEVQALLRAAGQSRHGLARRRNYALTQVLLQTGLQVIGCCVVVRWPTVRDSTEFFACLVLSALLRLL